VVGFSTPCVCGQGVPMTAVHSTTLRALFASLVRIIELDPAGADQKGVKAAVECISHVLEDDAAAAHLVQMPETTFGTVQLPPQPPRRFPIL